MLTLRGWLSLGVGAVLCVAGRALAAPELYVLGAAVGALALAGLVYVRASRVRLEVSRQVHPRRAQVGSTCRVDLEVRNERSRRSPVVTLRDTVRNAVDQARSAALLLPPLRSGETSSAVYGLPTDRRGLMSVGPLTVTTSDPFKMAAETTTVAGVSEVTVYPRVDRIQPVARTTGNDPLAGDEHPDALGQAGEDFYALRPYVLGDDLRRVHWPSTARHDDLMMRQEEIPWQGRVTVLIDDRPGRATYETFERMVSAAASVITASAPRQDLLRLITSQGADSGFASGNRHIESVMEHLASIEASDGEGSLTAVLARAGAGSNPGALVAIVGDLPDAELAELRQAGERFGAMHVVRFHDRGLPTGDRWMIDVGPGRPFADAWDAAMVGRRGRSRGGPALGARS